MGTSLRGNGSYKRDFLLSIHDIFGSRPFTIADVKSMSSYSPSVFYSLFHDGWLKKKSQKSPCNWVLSDRIVDIQNKVKHGDD